MEGHMRVLVKIVILILNASALLYFLGWLTGRS